MLHRAMDTAMTSVLSSSENVLFRFKSCISAKCRNAKIFLTRSVLQTFHALFSFVLHAIADIVRLKVKLFGDSRRKRMSASVFRSEWWAMVVCCCAFTMQASGVVENDNVLLGVLKREGYVAFPDIEVLHAKKPGLPALELRDAPTGGYAAKCKLNTMMYAGTHSDALEQFVVDHEGHWKGMKIVVGGAGKYVQVEWTMEAVRTASGYSGQLQAWKKEMAALNMAISKAMERMGPDRKKHEETRVFEQPDWGDIGVYLTAVTPAIAEAAGLDVPTGCQIVAVQKTWPAAAAGLQEGDIILEVNGAPVGAEKDVRVACTGNAGKALRVKIQRDGKRRTFTVPVQSLMEAAEAGDAYAQLRIGRNYFEGVQVAPDYEKAYRWFIQAHEQGTEPSANLVLALVCFSGLGVEKDHRRAMELLQPLADDEEPIALRMLGQCYMEGLGIRKNSARAVGYFSKAAELGDAGAMGWLGVCYMMGEGVGRDVRKAVSWYRKAALNGSADGMYLYGLALIEGEGVEQDIDEAMVWLRQAAKAGSSAAMGHLGLCAVLGLGMEQNSAQGLEWLKAGVAAGDAQSMVMLANIYKHGMIVPKDTKEALKLYRRAVLLNNAGAMTQLGICYLEGEGVPLDKKNAASWFKKAVDGQDAEGMVMLGLCYMNAWGVAENKREAYNCFQQAAGLGDASAMFLLGNCYANGYGVKKNEYLATQQYKNAADRDNTSAMALLGLAYIFGSGITEDAEAGIEWLKKAAGLGDADAMFTLGMCYNDGVGVIEDMDAAIDWMRQAAVAGSEDAVEYLDELGK
ncbi:MAG: PDZ domain-containing protein [Spartobacteria bacterium]|nr:PDZ domain-containing protein [Spartobacteria bacterium]